MFSLKDAPIWQVKMKGAIIFVFWRHQIKPGSLCTCPHGIVHTLCWIAMFSLKDTPIWQVKVKGAIIFVFLNILDKAWFTVQLSTWYSSHLVLNCHVFTERCSDLTSKGERSNHIWYLTAAKSATKSGKLFCGKMIHTPTPSKLDRGAEEQSFAQQLLRTLSSYSYELFKTSWTKQLLK